MQTVCVDELMFSVTGCVHFKNPTNIDLISGPMMTQVAFSQCIEAELGVQPKQLSGKHTLCTKYRLEL